MPNFRLPLSGDVLQNINPWNWILKAGQVGIININLGRSADPALEEEILHEVGSYGRQLGRISDVLGVLIQQVQTEKLSEDDHIKIYAFKAQLAEIERLKQKHNTDT